MSIENYATLKARVVTVQDMLTQAYFERASVNGLIIGDFLLSFKPLLSGESVASQDFLKEVFPKYPLDDTFFRINRFLSLLEQAKERTFRPKLEAMQDAMQIFHCLHNALCSRERRRAA